MGQDEDGDDDDADEKEEEKFLRGMCGYGTVVWSVRHSS